MKGSIPIIIPFIMFYLTLTAGLGKHIDLKLYFSILTVATFTSIFCFILSFFPFTENNRKVKERNLIHGKLYLKTDLSLLILLSYPILLIINILYSLGYYKKPANIVEFPVELFIILMISSMMYVGILAVKRSRFIEAYFKSIFDKCF